MLDSIYLYLKPLIYPASYYEEDEELSLAQTISVSWLFVIMGGIIRIALINLSFYALYQSLSSLDPSRVGINLNGSIGYYFLMFTTAIDLIFFPLLSLFLIQFWSFIIRSFANFVQVEGDIELKIEKVLKASLSTYTFHVLPIIGSMLQRLAGFLYLFIGLKREMKFSSALSICVLLSPIVFMMILVMLVLSFVLMSKLL